MFEHLKFWWKIRNYKKLSTIHTTECSVVEKAQIQQRLIDRGFVKRTLYYYRTCSVRRFWINNATKEKIEQIHVEGR